MFQMLCHFRVCRPEIRSPISPPPASKSVPPPGIHPPNHLANVYSQNIMGTLAILLNKPIATLHQENFFLLSEGGLL